MNKQIQGLYLIIDQQHTNKDIVSVAKDAVNAGVDIIQYREKVLSKKATLTIAEELRRITADAGVIFIINDDPAIAFAVDADGVHLGQEDMPVNIARKILGKEKIIGISTHNVQEVVSAKELNPDYIAFGPIFQSPTKMVTSPHGIDGLKQIRASIAVPLIAIGGINLDNVSSVINAGADGVAIISAVLSAAEIKEAVMEFKNLIYQTIKKQ
ncbi:MAG: thiamine phosphate synthase [Nitrospirae bacterium]|nr:thiamine phosphate synthase [Nitrospirota bacterium]